MKPATRDAQAYIIEQGGDRIILTKWRTPTPAGNDFCLEFHRCDGEGRFEISHVELTKETLDALQNAIESLTS